MLERRVTLFASYQWRDIKRPFIPERNIRRPPRKHDERYTQQKTSMASRHGNGDAATYVVALLKEMVVAVPRARAATRDMMARFTRYGGAPYENKMAFMKSVAVCRDTRRAYVRGQRFIWRQERRYYASNMPRAMKIYAGTRQQIHAMYAPSRLIR